LIIASTMMIISGLFGPAFWTTPFVQTIPALSSVLSPTTNLTDIWVPFVFGAFLIGHLPPCVKHVWEARSENGLPLAPLFLEWTPIIVFSTACTAWLLSPHSWILKDNHLTLFCLILSLVFGRMTTKIILAHLTRQPFPYWTVLLTPLVVGAVVAQLPTFGFPPLFDATSELIYLYAYLVVSFVVYARWAHLVITSICDFLGINCLTIPREKWKDLNGGPVITGRSDSPKKD
jgi:ethanolaminephosphotransferase